MAAFISSSVVRFVFVFAIPDASTVAILDVPTVATPDAPTATLETSTASVSSSFTGASNGLGTWYLVTSERA